MDSDEFSGEVKNLRPRKLRIYKNEDVSRKPHGASCLPSSGNNDDETAHTKKDHGEFTTAQKWKIAGVLSLVVSSTCSVMIVGTDAWKWDITTATLLAIACFGVTACAASESIR